VDKRILTFGWLGILLLLAGCDSGSGSGNASGPKSWGTPERIDWEDLGTAQTAQVAIDGNGKALAVWVQADLTRTRAWANTYDGSGWGMAECLEPDEISLAYWPQIAFDSAGHALAVWYQSDGTRFNIWADYYDGSSWGTAEKIESNDQGSAYHPQVAFDGDGNGIVVWYHSDGTRYSVWANYFNGKRWTGATTIESDNLGDATAPDPQIAFDGEGNAIAVWSLHDGSVENIWANYFNGTSWGAAEKIESDDTGSAYDPQIAFDGEGHGLAIWYQSDGTRYNIWSNSHDGTSWGTPELIETENGGPAILPQIASDGKGHAMAVWSQSDGIRTSIWANSYDRTGWGTAVLIETEDLGDAVSPQICLDGEGHALAVWAQSSGSGNRIWANYYDSTGWGTAELLETEDSHPAYSPQVSFDCRGRALAVWSQRTTGAYDDIWAARFE